jgi:hypothetical protein
MGGLGQLGRQAASVAAMSAAIQAPRDRRDLAEVVAVAAELRVDALGGLVGRALSGIQRMALAQAVAPAAMTASGPPVRRELMAGTLAGEVARHHGLRHQEALRVLA